MQVWLFLAQINIFSAKCENFYVKMTAHFCTAVQFFDETEIAKRSKPLISSEKINKNLFVQYLQKIPQSKNRPC